MNNENNAVMESYNFIVMSLQEYINSLPPASKIAMEQMAGVALKTVVEYMNMVEMLNNEITDLKGELVESKKPFYDK